jgi:hypothetical protein
MFKWRIAIGRRSPRQIPNHCYLSDPHFSLLSTFNYIVYLYLRLDWCALTTRFVTLEPKFERVYLRTYPGPHADCLAGHFHIGMTDGLRGGGGTRVQ